MKTFVSLYLGVCLCFTLISWKTKAQDTVTIHHQRYTTTFDTILLYPVKVHWVDSATNICGAGSPNHVTRTNDFKADPMLPAYTNLKADYHSGSSKYDRGHNMDAADNSCNITQMHECFYYSNMAPQTKHLNEITWEKLEEHTRDMATQYGKVDVWCGSYGSTEKIGRVTVPAYCWKVISYNGTVEAYIMPNTSDVNQQPYTFYKSTVTTIRATAHLMLNEIGENAKQ